MTQIQNQNRETIISGSLEAYWEQGMEGRIEYAFLPDSAEHRLDGSHPIFLQDGHFLRIFDADGKVLWAGMIHFVPRHWFIFYEKHNLGNGVWNDFKQKGVEYATWIGWFWQKPALRAELTFKT